LNCQQQLIGQDRELIAEVNSILPQQLARLIWLNIENEFIKEEVQV